MKKIPLFAGMLALVASCVSPKSDNGTMSNERLTYFFYDHHNSMRIYNAEKYNVRILEDGRVHVVIDEGCPQEKEFYLNDSTILDDLLGFVKTYKMDKYKEDYEPRMQIHDGDSWRLSYKYDSGRSKSSSGYMAWPDNYNDMRHALGEYFRTWRQREDGALRMDYFRFTGQNAHGLDIEYILERGENETIVTVRNTEKGVKKTFKVGSEILDEFQQRANMAQLKNKSYDYIPPAEDDATRCTYFVRYNSGDSISGKTGYKQYPGNKESTILEFFNRLIEGEGK